MWVKAIFTSIQEKSDACEHSFGGYIKWLIYCKMYEKCFYFLFKFMFLKKNVISEKTLKLISPSPLKKNKLLCISTIAQHHLLILFKKFLAPPPIWKRETEIMHSKWKITKERIQLLPFYLTDNLFTELKSHKVLRKK